MIRVTSDYHYDNGIHMHVDYTLNKIYVHNNRQDIHNKYDFEEPISDADINAMEQLIVETLPSNQNFNTDDSK